MRTKRKWLRLLASVTVVALVAAACGGDDDDDSGGDTATTEAVDVPEGGTLVIGAEQEPDCVAWILTCSGSSWGYWMMGVTTMPRSYDTVKDGDEWVAVPNPLLTGEAEVDESDPEKPVVTYSLNPDAVWSDGTAIIVRRLRVHVGRDRERRGHLRPDRVHRHRERRLPRSADGRGLLRAAVRRLEGALRWWLRGLPGAPPRGQGHLRGDGQRLRLVRWAVDDREVGEGRRGHARSQRRAGGARRPSSTRSSSRSRPTRRPSSRPSRTTRSR